MLFVPLYNSEVSLFAIRKPLSFFDHSHFYPRIIHFTEIDRHHRKIERLGLFLSPTSSSICRIIGRRQTGRSTQSTSSASMQPIGVLVTGSIKFGSST